jgi:hypothetical protein
MTTGTKLLKRYLATRAAINDVVGRLRGMPWILRTTCLASLGVGLALLVMSIFQIGSVRIDDEALSWGQIRGEGYYSFLIVSALLLTAAGVGIWLHRGWSRWIVVLLYLITSPIEIISRWHHTRGTPGLPWDYGIEAVVWGGFFYWYLFYKQTKFFDRPRGV